MKNKIKINKITLKIKYQQTKDNLLSDTGITEF